jgi:hypothetical protein
MTTKNISITQLQPEQTRKNLRLLLLANPNYFGNLQQSGFKPVLNIAGDTAFEELGCVGLSPSLSRLEAVVSIKQSAGYEGGVCSAGSQEYVRFYLSFNGGSTWVDQGVASFTAYDIPGPKSLEYCVALPISLPEDICFIENLPQVRAILSWNYIPPANTPDYSPIWGNVLNVTIQSPAFKFIIFEKLLALAKVQLPANVKQAVDLQQSVAAAPKKALGVAELADLYKGKPVSPARFLYPEIVKLSGNQTTAEAVTAGAKTQAKTSLASINVNIGDILGTILSTSGNTEFEELDCVGLDLNRSTLVGVVKVKLPYGFNGGLCTAGSTEYVAFWVDWGSGLQYAGTATFTTHDISSLPSGGLEYAVVLPVDVASHMQPCSKGAQTAKVRAILSWQTAPPTTDPNYVPVWGNQSNALVQIPSGQAFQVGTPNIAIIGGIGVVQIDTIGATARPGTTLPGSTLPGALFALQGSPADPFDYSRQCPFGGEITVQGLPSVGFKYRVWVEDTSSPFPTMLTHPIVTTDLFGNATTQNPGPGGFFTYLNTNQNIDNNLAYWYPTGNDLYNLWLEIADSSGTVLGRTPNYLIQVVSTPPVVDIHIDSGGDCKQFNPISAPTINGHFVVTESGTGTSGQIGHYSLGILPGGNAPVPSGGINDTGPAPSEVWSLSLAGMAPCGYVVQLSGWDNTIVDSAPGSWNGDTTSVGFCLVTGT